MTAQFSLHGPKTTIIMSPDRLVYSGPPARGEITLGGYAIYVCTGRPIGVTIGKTTTETLSFAIVPPFTRHTVHSGARVRIILAETESVSPELLKDERFQGGTDSSRAWASQIEDAFKRWESAPATAEIPSIDMFFLGERLPPRRLDDRIRRAVDVIRDAPSSRSSRTPTIAKEVSLSPSRLRHLFGEQVDVPIRRYRAWKRLRNSIQIASQEPNLLTLAMAAGYADASHMCNSMKLYLGEQPSFIRAHWRKATVVQTNLIERDPAAGHMAPAA